MISTTINYACQEEEAMKKKYTKEIHAARLTKMLERKSRFDILSCPASEGFITNVNSIDAWGYTIDSERAACKICKDFLSVHNCPCFALNSCAEAAKQTWLKLEEEGFI